MYYPQCQYWHHIATLYSTTADAVGAICCFVLGVRPGALSQPVHVCCCTSDSMHQSAHHVTIDLPCQPVYDCRPLCHWLTYWFGWSVLRDFFQTGWFRWRAPCLGTVITFHEPTAPDTLDWWGINYYTRCGCGGSRVCSDELEGGPMRVEQVLRSHMLAWCRLIDYPSCICLSSLHLVCITASDGKRGRRSF